MDFPFLLMGRRGPFLGFKVPPLFIHPPSFFFFFLEFSPLFKIEPPSPFSSHIFSSLLIYKKKGLPPPRLVPMDNPFFFTFRSSSLQGTSPFQIFTNRIQSLRRGKPPGKGPSLSFPPNGWPFSPNNGLSFPSGSPFFNPTPTRNFN